MTSRSSHSGSRAILHRRDLLVRLGRAAFLAAPVFRATLREADAATPPRFIVIQFPGGARFEPQPNGGDTTPDPWVPDHSFKPDKVLAPLASLMSDVLLLDGIGNTALKHGNGHSMQALLTGDSRGQDPDGDDDGTPHFYPPDLTSIDQLVAKQIGTQTRFPSLQFGVLTDTAPGFDPGALNHRRCVYNNGLPIQPVSDPKAMFSRLFGAGSPPPSSSPANSADADRAVQRVYRRKKSIIDRHRAEVNAIKALAGTQEQQKLEEHLTSLSELERGLVAPSGGGGGNGPAPSPSNSCAAPKVADSADLQADGAAMNELLFQAINCDLTRVATFQWLHSEPSLSFPWLGVNRDHHTMQHDPRDDFDKTQTWFVAQIASLLTRLKAASGGDGSLLDSCAVLVISEQSRSHEGIPTIGFIAGKARGAIRTGRTLVGNKRSLNDLYLGLAQAVGVSLETVGEAKFCTGPLSLG